MEPSFFSYNLFCYEMNAEAADFIFEVSKLNFTLVVVSKVPLVMLPLDLDQPVLLIVGFDILRRRKHDQEKKQDTDQLLAELEELRRLKAEKEQNQE